MRAPLERPSGAGQEERFLIVQAEPCSVSLRASWVSRLMPHTEWRGAEPLELDRALGVDVEPRGSARVFWLQTAAAGFPVLVRGALELTTVAAERVVPLPAWLCAGHCFREVLLREGRADALVIDPERLARSLPLPPSTPKESSAS